MMQPHGQLGIQEVSVKCVKAYRDIPQHNSKEWSRGTTKIWWKSIQENSWWSPVPSC